jgi:hypothetical protein
MKQETIEEAAETYAKEEFFSDQEVEIKIGKSGFIKGAKWMQERMYSEEEIDSVISDFKHDLKESTSTYVKQHCEGAIFGLERLKQFKENNK